MKYIEAPDIYNWEEKSLFLAWGISNCPDWQEEYINYFKDTSLVLLNPRRTNFNVADKSVEIEQITWEHEHLERSDIISFWFWKETICPIVLFELWKYASSTKDICVWVHPEYQRKSDVIIQLGLIRPEVKVVSTLENLAREVKNL